MLKRLLVPFLLAACLCAAPAVASAEQPYRDPAFSEALQTLLRAQWPNAYSADEQALTGSAADSAVRRGLYHARTASKSFPDLPTMVGWFSWGATRDGLQVRLQRNFDARWFSFGGEPFGGATPGGSFDDARWWSGCPLIGYPTPGCELELNGARRPGWYLELRTKGLPGGQLGRIRILDSTGAADCWFLYGDARCDLGQSVEEDKLVRELWLAQQSFPGTLDPLQEIRCVFGNTYTSFPCYVKTQPLDSMDGILKLDRFETWKDDGRAVDQVYPRYCTGCVYQVPDTLDLDAARAYLDGSGEEPSAARAWINARLRPSRTPLILIPGIQGTILNKNGSEAWPRAQTAFDDILGDRWLTDLSLDASGTAEADGGAPLVPIDLVGHIEVDTHIPVPGGTYHKSQEHYNVTRDRLVAAGYVEGVDLFTLPFDWRKSAASNADRLLAKIEQIRAQTGAAKVDILAHSQGGLVTDALLSTDRADGKVRRVLTLGTPVLGAPKAFGVIAYRTPCLVSLPFIGSCVHDARTIQEIVRNMPGVYELLPTATLQAMEGPAWTVGGVAETPSQLDSFVGNGANAALVGQARAWQSTVGAFRPHDPSIVFERVSGVGRGTIYGVDETTHTECIAWFFACEQVVDPELRLGDGDGTVPLASSALRLGSDDRSQGIPVAYTSEADHDGLAHADGVLAYAIAYFAQRTSPAALTFLSARRAADGILSSPPPFAAVELELTGPAIGAVADDSGHALGPKADLPAALVLDDIPGGSYEEVGRTRSYVVARPGSYTASFRVTGTRPVRILLRKHAGSTLAGQAEFVLAAPVPGETVRLAYGLDTSLDDARLELDANGDGTVDERVAPLGVVTGAAAGDTTPATSEAGATAADGGQALVMLAADDTGGAGLARIVYRVGAGQPATYAAPFLVPLGSTVEYRSIDRAGNVEQVRRLLADDAPNTRRFALQLQDGDKLRRFIDPQGDEDWFRFVLAGSASVKAELNGLPADYDLELVDSAGAVVAAPARRGKESEEIKAQLGAGTWFLRVSGYGGAWDRDHPYEVKLQLK